MTVPGLRILTKYWKRYAMLVLVAACFVVTVRVGQQWLEDAGTSSNGEILIVQRDSPDADNGDQPAALDSKDKQQVQEKPLDSPPGRGGGGGGGGGGVAPEGMSLREMEMRNAKLEAELKYERLKAEMLNRDLKNAKKNPSGGQEVSEDDLKAKLQERRVATIKRVCRENPKDTGQVRTVMTTRYGVTYCHIPGVMETFWLRVLRFVNKDYVIDPISPYDISQKDALGRPFIRLKQLKWSKLSEDDKMPLLRSKMFMAVQNPYMRLWEAYINSMVLPVMWSPVGVQIEAKRKSNALLLKNGMKKKMCGKDVTFEEFIQYTLETASPPYEPYHRLCDPCQLNPSYVVKTETAQEDSEKVLYHLNLDNLVKVPNFVNGTVVRYLNDLITDVWPRFSRSKAEHCVTPGDIGKSLWRALKLGGLINEGALPPLLDISKTKQEVFDMVTGLYISGSLNVEAEKARMMVNGYKTVSVQTKDAIRKKYKMDFQLFEYGENVEDILKGFT